MGFQSTVSTAQGAGVPGEIYADFPRRTQSYILSSVSAANNVFGRAFTVSAQGVAQVGNPGGANVYAGILVNPKGSASFGTTAGPLVASLTLANNAQAEIMSEGCIFVTLGAAAAIGDVVIFDNTTGVLSTITPGTDLPGGSSFAYANVAYFTVAAAGLAVIAITPAATGMAVA